MSNVIDQKVVEMRFDNKQFETNVATTMSSVDKLKKNLAGLDSSSNSGKGLNKLAEDLDDVRRRAEWLREFDIANWINNKLIYPIATALPRAFSDLFGGVAMKSGFSEYELKMGSIQTIMASTGESLETVNQYLGELNEYSDKTIYSFQDMTSNIGKFTNAGINLKDSVAAIQGVANVAAVSGANANEASRAMYNFSQALSSGYVKLIDWKSIENANMATVEFKNQLLETAVAEKKLTKTSDGMYKTLKGTTISATKMFNDSLQEQWMTSEVLTKTLAKYADETTEIGKKATAAATEVKTLSQLYDTLKESAQSGWAQTWEIIVGDFEEAKKFLSELNDIIGGLIGRSSTARNELLENWKVLGGREDIIETFRNLVKAISAFVKPIKDAWGEVFSPLTSEGLKGFTEGIKKFTEKLILTDEAAANLKRLFKGVFSIVSLVVEVFKGLGTALGIVGEFADDGSSAIYDFGGGLLGILGTIGDILASVAEFVKETKIIRNAFIVAGKAIKFVLEILGDLIGALVDGFECGPLQGFTSLLDGIGFTLGELADSSTDFGERFKMAIKNLGTTIKNSEFYRIVSSLVSGIKGMAVGLVRGIVNTVKGIGSAIMSGDVSGLMEFVNNLLDGGILVALGLLVKRIVDLLGGSGLVKTIKNVCESVSEYFGALAKNIHADSLSKIAKAIGILTIALIALAFIPADKLEKSLAAITLAFGELLVMFALMGKIGKSSIVYDGKGKIWGNAITSVTDSISQINTMVAMMVALIGMTWVIQRMGALDVDTLVKGCIATTVLLGAMAGVMIALSKFQTVTKESLKVGKDKMSIKYTNQIKGMVTMALALLILSVPLKILGSMEWEEWARGVGGIVILLGALMGVEIGLSRLGENGKTMLAGSGAVAIMAFALNLIIPTLLVLGFLPFKVWLKGIGGLLLVLVALMGVEVAFGKLGDNAGKRMLAGAGAVAIITATLWTIMPLLAVLGLTPWEFYLGALGKLALMLVALGAVEVAFGLLGDNAGKRMLAGAGAIAIMTASLNMLLPTLLLLGIMPWDNILRSLTAVIGVIGIFATALILMTNMTKVVDKSGTSMILAATSMVIMAAAINLLVPALIALGLVPFPLVIAALLEIGAAIAIFVIAASILAGIGKPLMIAAAAMALFAAAALGIAGALALMGHGFHVIAAGLLVLLGVLTTVLASAGIVVVGIVKIIGAVLVAVLDLLIDAMPKIAEFVGALIGALCDIIIQNVPKIVAVVLELITQTLASLAEFIPQIVGYLIDIVAGILQTLFDKLPDIFSKIKLSPETITQLMTVILELAAVMSILSTFAILGSTALIGVLFLGAVLAELAIVLAAIGLIYKIPYIGELIEGGGELLRLIGAAIGKFIGGIIGGISAGAIKSLPEVGENLSGFMENASTFLSEVSVLNKDSLSGIKTFTDVIRTIARWSDESSSLDSFGYELVSFATYIKEYSDIVADVDNEAIVASAKAAESLSTLARNLPNSGGLLGAIVGENDISTFGEMLIPFGKGLAEFSTTVADVDPAAITNIVPAAQSLSELAKALPNSGGLVSVFAGDNTMDTFGDQLAGFGRGIKNFATEVSGLVNDGSIDTAIGVAKSLVEVSNDIPSLGGIMGILNGENNIETFANSLTGLGRGIAGFAINVTGIDVSGVEAAAGAAKAIALMTKEIPSQNGIATWLTGKESISAFANQLPTLGEGLRDFANSTIGINLEALDGVTAAASSVVALTNAIPNPTGIKAWFKDEDSISTFADQLPSLGNGLKGLSDAVSGMSAENVEVAANAAKTLAEMSETIPNQSGIKAWFKDENSITTFANQLPVLGSCLKGLSDAVTGMNPDNVTAAANAAKTLAEMSETIPNQSGIKAWFADENAIVKFANQLPVLGEGLVGFSSTVEGLNTDNVESGANAAKSLAEMSKIIPNQTGFAAWFGNKDAISKFATQLPALGEGLSGFSESVAGINPDNVTAAANAAKALAQMADTAPKDSSKVATFGTNIKAFGTKLKEYFDVTKDIPDEAITAASKALDEIKEVSNINSGNVKSLATAIKELTKAIKQMATDIKDDLKTAGKEAIESFISGIDEQLAPAETACTDVLTACVTAISEGIASFHNAGANLVTGFANGISETTYLAEARSRAMAAAAAEAAKKELDEHSPSRVGVEIGDYFGIGFVNGIANNIDKAYGASSDMADSAKEGLRSTVSKIGDLITNDIDAQPTIRPVLDLSDVRNGAGAINSLFNSSTLGVSANVGNISTLMSRYNQNGANEDIVSAIDMLRKDVKQMETASYSIGNVSLTGDQEVEDAFNTIIRAVNMARRT